MVGGLAGPKWRRSESLTSCDVCGDEGPVHKAPSLL